MTCDNILLHFIDFISNIANNEDYDKYLTEHSQVMSTAMVLGWIISG